LDWVKTCCATVDDGVRILDIGGRDLNGTPKHLFPNAAVYHVLDVHEGPNVDIVADAASWLPFGKWTDYDMVLATEVFEHTPHWREIISTAYRALRDGGRFVATMAGPGRGPHSGIAAEPRLRPGEWYANIDPLDLSDALSAAGFEPVLVDQHKLDVRCWAVKR
jgi:SAM-dependent methyltransferase